MKRSFSLAIPVFVGIMALSAFGQAPPQPMPKPVQPIATVESGPCPRLEIQGPSGKILRDGQPVSFGVNIAGGDNNIAPTIIWNVSAGTITSGQGTRTIHVDSTGAGSDRQIVADLWVGGYAPECVLQASAAVRVAGPANKFDEFGELTAEKESERLAALVSAATSTNDHVVVFAYAGRTNVRGHAGNMLRRIKTQLAASGLQGERISITDAGFREQPAVELWLVPEGSEAPRPSPTVDRKEIVYPKTAPTRTTPAKKP